MAESASGQDQYIPRNEFDGRSRDNSWVVLGGQDRAAFMGRVGIIMCMASEDDRSSLTVFVDAPGEQNKPEGEKTRNWFKISPTMIEYGRTRPGRFEQGSLEGNPITGDNFHRLKDTPNLGAVGVSLEAATTNDQEETVGGTADVRSRALALAKQKLEWYYQMRNSGTVAA